MILDQIVPLESDTENEKESDEEENNSDDDEYESDLSDSDEDEDEDEDETLYISIKKFSSSNYLFGKMRKYIGQLFNEMKKI